MNISKLLSTSLVALCLCLSMSACDGGDDEGGDTADEGNADETTGGNGDGDGDADSGGEDITCSVYCVSFIEMCLQTGDSTEFETDAQCNEACAMWDQAGVNCRYEQIIDGACGEAGNMGSTCQ